MTDYLVVYKDGSYEAVSDDEDAERASRRENWLCNISLGTYRLGVRSAMVDEILVLTNMIRSRIADNAQAVREKYGDQLTKERLKEIDDMLCGQRHGIADVVSAIRGLVR